MQSVFPEYLSIPRIFIKVLLCVFFFSSFCVTAQDCNTTFFANKFGFDGAGNPGFLEKLSTGQFIFGGLRNNKNTVLKVDKAGVLLWSRQYDFTEATTYSNHNDAKPDRNGNYFISVNGGAIAMLDTAGNVMTMKKVKGANTDPEILFLGVLADNKKIILFNDGYYGYILFCVSPNLSSVVWSQYFERNNTDLLSMKIIDNKIYVTGVSGDNGLLLCFDAAAGNVLVNKTYKADDKRTVLESLYPYNEGYIVNAIYQGGEVNNHLILRLDKNFNVLNFYRLPTVYDNTSLALAVEPEGNFYGAWASFRFAITNQDSILWNRLSPGAALTDPVKFYSTDEGLVLLSNTNFYNVGVGTYGSIMVLSRSDNNGIIPNCGLYNYPFEKKPIGYTTGTFNITEDTAGISLLDVSPVVSDISYVTGTGCKIINDCHSLLIEGTRLVCSAGQVLYTAKRNAGCYMPVTWQVYGGNSKQQKLSDSSIAIQFLQTGTYKLVAGLGTTCTSVSDTIEVFVSSVSQMLDIGPPAALICPLTKLILNAHGGFISYQWQDGSADSTFIVNTPGTYFVKAVNSCGNTLSDSIVITFANIPPLSIGSDQQVCQKDTLLLNASAGFVNYNWLPQSLISSHAAQISIVPVKDETITVTATTAEGCIANDTMLVKVISAKQVFIGADTSFCEYDSIRVNAGPGFTGYLWNTGSNQSAITLKKTGTYWVKVQDANGCYSTDTLAITTFSRPAVNLGNDINLCSGGEAKLDAGNFIAYLWQDGSASRFFSVRDKGIYRVKVTDQNNCVAVDSMEVKNILPLPSRFLKSTDSLCSYDKLIIEPAGSYSGYTWSDGSVQPTLIVDKPGNYILVVKDVNGCSGADTITVIQKNCYSGVFIPGAFSPDGNQLNDIFRVKVYGNMISFRLDVFNRYGKLVFSTPDPQKGWDGKYKGALQNTGAFIWQCYYNLQGGKPTLEQGTLMLIR